NTASGNRRIGARENRNGAKRWKRRRRSSSAARSTSSGCLNGYSKVMCAGTPAAAEGSYRSRKGFTRGSASGTNTTSADSFSGIWPRLHHMQLSQGGKNGSTEPFRTGQTIFPRRRSRQIVLQFAAVRESTHGPSVTSPADPLESPCEANRQTLLTLSSSLRDRARTIRPSRKPLVAA